MYYTSESSDSENALDSISLDFSYLLMDSESAGLHLTNSVQELAESKNSIRIAKNIDSSINNNNSKKSKRSLASKLESELLYKDTATEKLLLHHNLLLTLPYEVTLFSNLKFLDLSNNNLTHINDFLINLVNLQTLYLKNNGLGEQSFPKDFAELKNLKELNLSGNCMQRIPLQIYDMVNLKFLYMGSNEIVEVLPEIKNLKNLQVLHLGGNELVEVPDELGLLNQLGVLALCDNKIRRLPRVISQLTKLRSLLLHKNNMCCLPVGIVKLRGLTELSLRDNPLVSKFVNCCAKEIICTPPSLLELSARVIKLKDIKYEKGAIPTTLDQFVNSGQKCVNPKCKGMYFTSCVEHIKFVDFCGKYRVPLMHYLCSSKCSSTTPSYYRSRSDSDSEDDYSNGTLRKVLLG